MDDGAAKVKVSIPQNRLYIIVRGYFGQKQAENLYTEIRFGVADLKPGFDVIHDLTKCRIGALKMLPIFYKIRNFLIENKTGRVVRVIDESTVALKQLLNLSAMISSYQVEYFNSMEEAEEALSKSGNREALRFILHNQKVTFNSDNVGNEGQIIDISTHGCAITSDEAMPETGDIGTILVEFKEHEGLINALEVRSEVKWVKDNSFGVEFQHEAGEQESGLWERLVFESQKSELPKLII